MSKFGFCPSCFESNCSVGKRKIGISNWNKEAGNVDQLVAYSDEELTKSNLRYLKE